MLVITTKEKTLGAAMPTVCSRCGAQTYYGVLKTRRWLTFLWKLPLLPLGTGDYYLFCSTCSGVVEARDTDATTLRKMVQMTQQYLDYEIDHEQYATALATNMNEFYAGSAQEIREELLEDVEQRRENPGRGFE